MRQFSPVDVVKLHAGPPQYVFGHRVEAEVFYRWIDRFALAENDADGRLLEDVFEQRFLKIQLRFIFVAPDNFGMEENRKTADSEQQNRYEERMGIGVSHSSKACIATGKRADS